MGHSKVQGFFPRWWVWWWSLTAGGRGAASRERAAIAGTSSPVTGVTVGGKEKKTHPAGLFTNE